MKKNFIILLLLICLPLSGCSAMSELSSNFIQTNQWYTVSDYVDGDTFKIKTGNNVTTVRLLYIDTPETVKPYTEIEPFGPEASAFTKQLLNESGEVRLTFDKEMTDKYGRTLAIVELRNGQILNESLLEQGLAKVLIVEPNVKMENVYKKIEQLAKQSKQGIWSDASEVSRSDLPTKKAAPTGITTVVDKRAEFVTITNTTDQAISLTGWKLVSVRGNQIYTFKEFTLDPKEKVIISSSEEPIYSSFTVFQWGEENIWNNSESDPAELYNTYNELVSIWED